MDAQVLSPTAAAEIGTFPRQIRELRDDTRQFRKTLSPDISPICGGARVAMASRPCKLGIW